MENLLLATLQNIKVHRRLRPRQLCFLLKVDSFMLKGLLLTLHHRMLITFNSDGSYSPRPQGDGLKHPQDFTPVEGRPKRRRKAAAPTPPKADPVLC